MAESVGLVSIMKDKDGIRWTKERPVPPGGVMTNGHNVAFIIDGDKITYRRVYKGR